MARVGVAENANTAVLVTLSAKGEFLDRRTIELTKDLPTHPYHHEGAWAVGRYLNTPGARKMPLSEAIALVEKVQRAAEAGARSSLESLSAAISEPIKSISLRVIPPLPATIEARIKDNRAQTTADSAMYRQALATAAKERGWSVHWYDKDELLEREDPKLSAIGKQAGSPWQAKHKLAATAALLVALASCTPTARPDFVEPNDQLVEGIVRGFSGAPIAFAKVTAHHTDCLPRGKSSASTCDETTTDQEGHYRLRVPPWVDRATVSLSSDRLNRMKRWRAGIDTLDFELGDRTITGLVTSPSGAPVGEAFVLLDDGSSATTNYDGTFKLEGIAPSATRLTVLHDLHPRLERTLSPSEADLRLQLSEGRTVQVEVIGGPCSPSSPAFRMRDGEVEAVGRDGKLRGVLVDRPLELDFLCLGEGTEQHRITRIVPPPIPEQLTLTIPPLRHARIQLKREGPRTAEGAIFFFKSRDEASGTVTRAIVAANFGSVVSLRAPEGNGIFHLIVLGPALVAQGRLSDSVPELLLPAN